MILLTAGSYSTQRHTLRRLLHGLGQPRSIPSTDRSLRRRIFRSASGSGLANPRNYGFRAMFLKRLTITILIILLRFYRRRRHLEERCPRRLPVEASSLGSNLD